MDFQGKAVIVTGAGSGIGRAMALGFARAGARVLAADVSGAEQRVARESAGEVIARSCDVADEAQVRDTVAAGVQAFGRIDVICNNAGVSGPEESLHAYPVEAWDRVISIDLRGSFLMLKYGVAAMLRTAGGAIVNTASVAATQATPGFVAYTAAKAGVVALTRQAAAEYAAHRIRVNAICPGMIDTSALSGISEPMRQAITGKIPLGRLGLPEEAASLAMFLASDEAAYITGQSYVIDGGSTA